jgi:hypothetical protein
MADPDAIRSAMADTLRNAFTDFQVTGYVLESPVAPGFEIDVDPEGVNYDQAMGRGLDEWWWVVRGFVSGSSDIGGQKNRDQMLRSSGDRSVKATLETDRTLAGACHDLRVVEALPRAWTVGDTEQLIGAEWRVRLMAAG